MSQFTRRCATKRLPPLILWSGLLLLSEFGLPPVVAPELARDRDCTAYDWAPRRRHRPRIRERWRFFVVWPARTLPIRGSAEEYASRPRAAQNQRS